MKAIQIKYLPVTDTKGSRYKASIKDEQGIIASITESVDYRINEDRQVEQLAKKLMKKLNWETEIAGIGVYGGDYYVILK